MEDNVVKEIVQIVQQTGLVDQLATNEKIECWALLAVTVAVAVAVGAVRKRVSRSPDMDGPGMWLVAAVVWLLLGTAAVCYSISLTQLYTNPAAAVIKGLLRQ